MFYFPPWHSSIISFFFLHHLFFFQYHLLMCSQLIFFSWTIHSSFPSTLHLFASLCPFHPLLSSFLIIQTFLPPSLFLYRCTFPSLIFLLLTSALPPSPLFLIIHSPSPLICLFIFSHLLSFIFLLYCSPLFISCPLLLLLICRL